MGFLGLGRRNRQTNTPPKSKVPASNRGAKGNIDSIADGYELIITQNLNVPLEWLRRAGERHPGPQEALPDVPMAFGVWVPTIDSGWEQFGLRNPPPSKVASPIGPVDADQHLRFLIAVREAIESHNSVKARRSAVLALRDQDNEVGRYWAQHAATDPDWFDSYLGYAPQLGLPDNMHSTAKKLYAAGLHSELAVHNASDEDLLKVKGIGQKTLERIRAE